MNVAPLTSGTRVLPFFIPKASGDGWGPATWADIAVATFTALLAVATFVLAWKTRQAVVEAQRATKAAVSEAAATVKLAEQGADQMRRSSLPLVVPELQNMYVEGSSSPGSSAEMTVRFEVFNHGGGVTLGLKLTITTFDLAGRLRRQFRR